MSESRVWRVAGFGFDHMHMGDQLRTVLEHPEAELVGVHDAVPARMAAVCADLGISADLQFLDWEACLERTRPDIAIVCSTTADHLLWCERLTARGVHVQLEKPFATSVAEADRMMSLARTADVVVSVNWPLAWVESHRTTHRLIGEGHIGEVTEIHYYDGNRGPLHHGHDKHEIVPTAQDKRDAWWYSPEAYGGSLRDYLGYGAVLGTWMRDGELPEEVTAVTHAEPGLLVDEQSVVIARYASGLSTFQTRWGTFTDPWTHQPTPGCGFQVVGTRGTIASWDYAPSVIVQTVAEPAPHAVPVDPLGQDTRNNLSMLVSALSAGGELLGPTSAGLSRSGQLIVDSAITSAASRRPHALVRTDQT